MRTYCFKCVCGDLAEENRLIAERKKPMLCKCGKKIQRDFAGEQCGRRNTPGTYRMESYAAGIDPSEIPEFRKIDAAGGVPTDYSNDGDPIFTSAKHRRKYCRVHKIHDRNAGYSDPVPD